MSPECELPDPPHAVEVEKKSLLKKAWRSYSQSHYGAELENDLVKEYLPMVKGIVGRMAMSLPAHIHQDDLLSPAMVGLLGAIRNYDPKHRASFEGYAKLRIRGAILDELRRLDWVPRTIHEKAKKVERAILELEGKLQRMPEETEIAESLNISLGEYQKLLKEIRPVAFVSIEHCDDPRDDLNASGIVLDDESMPSPDELTSKLELIEGIKQRIEKLPQKMKQVLAFYYYENMRLKEIAAILGVTESRVCQIHAEAILLIRGLAKDL
jgi:RNA polymerase sigma factor for flagellar operon FliA